MAEEEEEEELGNWSDLPYHLVELIMEKMMIPELSDYIRCGGVCSSWRTAFLDHPHPLPRRLQQPPFLIVPTPISYSTTEKTPMWTNTKSISFYNIIHQKVYNQFQINIPNYRYFHGSSHGWLVLVDDYSQVRLFNPFLTPSPSSEIVLPSLKHLPIDDNDNLPIDDNDTCNNSYLIKVVLSADPSSNPTDYIVVAIFGSLERLAYYRPTSGGDEDEKRWIPVEIDDSVYYSSQYQDVIYCTAADRFLALHHPGGEVLVLYPEQDMKVIMCVQGPPEWTQIKADMPDMKFLVESSGDLLQIHRYVKIHLDTGNATYTFRVFNIVVNDDQELEWIHLKNLGDRTLFVGNNNDTISVCASNYPGCKPNCIYFIKQPQYTNHELGVFNLEDESIVNHYPTDKFSTLWIWMRESMVIWIEPSVQKKIIITKYGDQNILTELIDADRNQRLSVAFMATRFNLMA